MVRPKGNIRQNLGKNDGLSPRDSTLFKNLMELFNLKHYKKALKLTESLLVKYPNHGEVLSMKALLLFYTDPKREDEIFDFAKRGLKNDIKSYLCWHILGVIYKNKKCYKDSVKCFSMALKIDPKNERLLKDLCSLAIELRDYSLFRRFGSDVLQLRSKYYRDWVLFAFCNHLCGNLTLSQKILQEADIVFNNDYRVESFELSEAMLYRGMLCEQLGKNEDCIKLLNEKESVIRDKIVYLELKGKSAFIIKDYSLAHNCYKELLYQNPGNVRYAILYLATHENIEIRNLFLVPTCEIAEPQRGSISESQFIHNSKFFSTLGGCDAHGSIGSSADRECGFSDSNCAVLLSDEILDIDGEYSAGGWSTENFMYHTFDRFVAKRRISTAITTSNDKENVLFVDCYSYRDYVNRTIFHFDIDDLPAPDSVSNMDSAISIISGYLKDYPGARRTIYTRQRVVPKRGKYPLFLFLRDISREEADMVLNALDSTNIQDSPVYKCLFLSFTPRADFVKCAHRIICSLLERGSVNTFKYCLHTFTFEVAYLLLVLLSKYDENLSAGNRMDHGIFAQEVIGNSTSTLDKSVQDFDEHYVCCQYMLVLVRIFLANVYDYVGSYEKALSVINSAVGIAPTCVDIYCMRGKIYRHVGDFLSSKQDFCMASDLDRSDRQTSAKAAKAILRAYEFESSRIKWRSFLVEDGLNGDSSPKDGLTQENSSSMEPKNGDIPTEVPSFKFELLFAKSYRNLYTKSLLDGDGCKIFGKTGIEWLKMSLGIYIMIVERHHEIYNDQLDFHNYCLNRLAYRTYYHFLRLKNIYCCQGYFIKATKGVFFASLELHKLGLEHCDTKCTTDTILGRYTSHQNLLYCLSLMRIITSQRAYDVGLYSTFYNIANVCNLSIQFKIQCMMRAYFSCMCNPVHHKLYPIVFDLFRTVDLSAINEHELSIFYKASKIVLHWADEDLAMNPLKRCFTDKNANVLSPNQAAVAYLNLIVSNKGDSLFYGLKHTEALVQCVYNLDDTLEILERIFTMSRGAYKFCTFDGYKKHYLFLVYAISDCKVDVNRELLRKEKDHFTGAWKDVFPRAFNDNVLLNF